LPPAADAALTPHNTLLEVDGRLADSLGRFKAEMASSKGEGAPRAFVIRCLNIMDPLLPTNNLGRSVVRSSFARIRRAFGHAATLLRCVALKVRIWMLFTALVVMRARELPHVMLWMQAVFDVTTLLARILSQITAASMLVGAGGACDTFKHIRYVLQCAR
jgi:hypothetical protein